MTTLDDLAQRRTALKMINPAPYNAEAPPEALAGEITPTELHYVRSNFAVPAHDGALHVAGAVASELGARVGKLVLVTPLWLSGTPLRIDPGGPLGAYRVVDPGAYGNAWRAAAPEHERQALIPDGWFEAWVRATLATDPGSPAAGAIRAPSGAVQDVRDHWTAGTPLYDPAAITCPVLVLCAEWDVDVRFDMAHDLFVRLAGTPYKRLVEIGAGTHMVLMEKNRTQAFDAVIAFLDERFAPAS